ncbi:hypothetical protein KM043_009256 [Ampulex compressa]|nr:hypothetical protein KM043_009256 [Ampulex compressa]
MAKIEQTKERASYIDRTYTVNACLCHPLGGHLPRQQLPLADRIAGGAYRGVEAKKKEEEEEEVSAEVSDAMAVVAAGSLPFLRWRNELL